MTDSLRRAEDQDVRDEAIDCRRSFIVRAPAGSGKTTLLIQRYLALLVQVEAPEEIVAITFTRKAAAEMRERVLNALAEANNAASKLDVTSRVLARAALAHDAKRGWRLAANASRLRIQTIDSLNASIARQLPLAARFGAQPEVVEDARALNREAARALLAEVNATGPLADDVGALLKHLDNNLSVVETLLAEMLQGRDHWLRDLPRMNEREALEAALARVRANAIADVARRFPISEEDETLALARFAIKNMPESRTDARVCQLKSIAIWPDARDEQLPLWLGLADFLLSEKGEWRKRRGLNVNVGFPPGAEFKAMKERMGDLLERLASDGHEGQGNILAAALDALRQLPPAAYTETQWEALGAIVRLLPQATAMLWTVFSAHGQCDFTEMSQAASRALGSDDAPSDLALALDYRLQHLLVDEFQDTSAAQFELLEKLTRGWDAGDGRTMFLVGDPMQSIYRFREAEVGLFQKATEEGIGTVNLEALHLTVNFRSRRSVVEWVNRTFAELMPADAIDGDSQVPYAECSAFGIANDADEPAIQWHPQLIRKADGDSPVAAPIDDREIEARSVVAIIRAAQPPETIALLVRNRSHLASIVPALKAAGIVFRAVDIDPLNERPAVRDLLALTRALLHAADRIAWLSVLRAPWCGLTLDDLARLTGGAQVVEGSLAPDARTLWEIIHDDSRVSTLSADGRERLTSLREVLTPAMALRRRRPLRESVESAWLALRGPACLANAADLDDAAQLLDLLDAEAQMQTGGNHIIDLELLDARVNKLFAANRPANRNDGESGNVLQIMTIHKAKGLEFDIVIVPALHRIPRGDARKLLTWADRQIPGSHQRELLLAPIRETGVSDETDAIHRYVMRHEQARQREEDVRLLYVAATRAKRHLHLLGSANVKNDRGEEKLATPRAGSLLASLWPAVEPVFGDAMRADESAPTAMETTTVTRVAIGQRGVVRLAAIQRVLELPPAIATGAIAASATILPVIEFEWVGETARHVGTVVHVFLQRIADEGLTHWNRERVADESRAIEAELRRSGVESGELPAATSRVVAAIVKTLDDQRGRWTLDTHREAKSEWRLTGVIDGRIVNVAIDRTFVDRDGVRWIIDYKTGGHDGGDIDAFLDNEQERYRQQLESYAALLQHLSGTLVAPAIKLGLYFPQLKGWREWAWKASL